MSISFETAVGQLQSMFPAVDTEVIITVLESNGGHMQHTVSQLLEIDVPSDAVAPSPAPPPVTQQQPRASSGTTVTSAVDLATGRSIPQPASQRSSSTQGRARSNRGGAGQRSRHMPRKWRHPLPDDFLRVPGADRPPITSTSNDQLTNDLLLAQMMEDELFLEELRQNPDFAAYLEAEEEFFHRRDRTSSTDSTGRRGSSGTRRRRQRSVAEARGGGGGGGSQGRPSGSSWASKISSMGDEMKRKFNAFAMKFRRRGGQETGQDPMQYRSLLVDGDGGDGDDDDDDVVTRPADSTVQRRHVGAGDTLAPAAHSGGGGGSGGRDPKKSE